MGDLMVLRRFTALLFGALVVVVGFGARSEAHPVPYKGAWGLMSFNSSDMTEVSLVHSFTSQLAVATTYLKSSDSEFYIPRLNWLAKRWNNEDSQANIYLSGGIGSEVFKNENQTVRMAGLGMDWESRRYYVLFDQMYLHRDNRRNLAIPNESYGYMKFRVGTAPFLAEYDELNVWLILQAERYVGRGSGSGLGGEEVELTQILRFYVRNTLWEIGTRLNGGWVFNYMVHF